MCHKSSATICIDDEYKFTYQIAEIKYVEREDGEYYYEIIPDYSVIGLLSDKYFQGIPGINLDLKKKSYYKLFMAMYKKERKYISSQKIHKNY